MHVNLIKDNLLKLTRMAAIGTTAATLTLASTVPPSFAAPAPNCVVVRSQARKSITVQNQCRTQQRVKLIIAFGRDSACRVINPSGIVRFTWTFGNFDRLERC